jgi:hypothetical protein
MPRIHRVARKRVAASAVEYSENNSKKKLLSEELSSKTKRRFPPSKQKSAEDGIRTRASEEIGALNRRLRPTRPPPHMMG